MADDDASTSPSLIQRIKADDADAWRRMVELYTPLVYSWCRKAGMRPEDAKDACQEIMCAAWSGIDGFRRERPQDTFRGWLYTITRHKIIDLNRRNRIVLDARGGTSAQVQLLQEPEPDEFDDTLSPETIELFRRALGYMRGEFEEHTQQAFWLATVEEKSPKEVAEELGMTPGAVRQAKYKVLRRLRQELGDLEN